MSKPRLPGNDPRTLAREIPGMLEALFPHLVPAVVGYLNHRSIAAPECMPVSNDAVRASALAPAMLFEIAVALAQQLLDGTAAPDWSAALALAIRRQRRHFDAQEPTSLSELDMEIALRVASNLVSMLRTAHSRVPSDAIVAAPTIPGFQWIATGLGDFAFGSHLVEVKCTSRNFSAGDYRQVLMYWLLSYAGALEGRCSEWSHVVLLNPRSATSLEIPFDELVRLLAAGRSKVELLELFASIVDERRVHIST